MDIGNIKAGGGGFQWMTLPDLLDNLVNNAGFGALVVGAILLGIGFLYNSKTGKDLTDNMQFVLVIILSPVVVLAAYLLRLSQQWDYYTLERLYAVLFTSGVTIVSSDIVRRLFMKWYTRRQAKQEALRAGIEAAVEAFPPAKV